jgi:predicted DNA-binding transcriptional regulator AlpA
MEEPREEYLTVAELSEKIKFSKQTIYNLIFKREFILQQHYLKPRPKKILFKWSAVKAWLETTPVDFNSKSSSRQGNDLKEKSLINI